MSPGELDEIVSTGDAPQVVRVPGHYWHGFSVVGDEPAMLVYFVNRVARAWMRCGGCGTIQWSCRRRSTARRGTPGAGGRGTGSGWCENDADGEELINSARSLCIHQNNRLIIIIYLYTNPVLSQDRKRVVNSELVGISLALMRVITIATQGGNHSLSRCFENQ